MIRATFLLILFILAPAMILFPDQNKEDEGWKELIGYAEEFVQQLSEDRYDEATSRFDTVVGKALPAEQLEQVWNSIKTKVGEFQKQSGHRTESMAGYRIVYIACDFKNAKLDAKLVFNTQNQIAGLFFIPHQPPAEYKPPDYANPGRFDETEVRIGSGEWELPGILTLPKGDGPFPAVVLVHGSGPNDRDETIGPNKPFRDLAWGLATKGIAVLRYDKRTLIYGQKMVSEKLALTVQEETIEDALEAASLLKQSGKIDAGKIFILGHSLGGMLIPRIAHQDKNISGFIVMGGAARPLEDAILEQTTYILSLDGFTSKDDRKKIDELKAEVEKVKGLAPSDKDKHIRILGATPVYWLDLQGYHPPDAAQTISRPLLILQGGRDYQVTPKEFEFWKKTLGGQANVEFKIYPALNHLFIKGKGPSTPQEYQKAGNIDKNVIDDIAKWIKKKIKMVSWAR